VFKPRIINSVHASADSLHGRGMNLSLATDVKDAAESEGDTRVNTNECPCNP
jgi:hypothetical protein